VNIPGRIMLDSKENKTEGKNLFELFRKIVYNYLINLLGRSKQKFKQSKSDPN